MGAKEVLRVVILDEDCAWELFKIKIGDNLLSDPKIYELAKQISSSCRGLPILLLAIARAMASRATYDQWEVASNQVTDFYGDTFQLLKFCFDSLPNDRAKSCLLYFSLFPEDFTSFKNNLIDFWICEGLLGHDDDDTEEDFLNVGYDVVDILVRACLLDEEVNYVKLQDVIRDSALSTVAKSKLFKNAQLVDATSPKKLKTVGWISHLGKSIQDVVKIPPNLLTFFMNHNPFVMIKGKISLFMTSLKVLDLSNSGIEEVPREISTLVSLRHLNLSHTWIDRLPVELQTLVNLECLNLEHDDQLRVIPKPLISAFSSLPVLKMFRCGFSVEELAGNILSVRNMDIDPILCLEHLKVLSITITCDSALSKLLSNPKFFRCTQSLSLEVFWGSKSIDISPLAAMKNLLTLEIHQIEDLEELNAKLYYPKLQSERSFERLREVNVANCLSLLESWVVLVPNLTVLRVIWCVKMKEMINLGQPSENLKGGDDLELFSKLESLVQESLPDLKSIYLKPLPFRCLKKIEVSDCSLLKKLPLNYDSIAAKEVVIEAEEDWWNDVEWENESTKTALCHLLNHGLIEFCYTVMT